MTKRNSEYSAGLIIEWDEKRLPNRSNPSVDAQFFIDLHQKLIWTYKKSYRKEMLTGKPLLDGTISLFYTYINAKIKFFASYLLLTFVVRSSTFYLSILLRNSEFSNGKIVQNAFPNSILCRKIGPSNNYETLHKFGPQCHNGLMHRSLVYNIKV